MHQQMTQSQRTDLMLCLSQDCAKVSESPPLRIPPAVVNASAQNVVGRDRLRHDASIGGRKHEQGQKRHAQAWKETPRHRRPIGVRRRIEAQTAVARAGSPRLPARSN
jgi:hypothetical protein